MGYRYRVTDLYMDKPFKDITGTQYPANWLRLAPQEAKDNVPGGGITWEPDPKPWNPD